jgi:hypothetical protein
MSVIAALLVIGLAASMSACANNGSAGSSTTTGASLSGRSDPSTQVLSAYRAMWADLVSAARTSDFQSPLLSQHATGDALQLFTQGLARDQLHGIVTRGQVFLHPTVTSLSRAADPDRATVTDCLDDSQWMEYKVSGGLAKNGPGGRRATTAMLAKKSGAWKVTEITVGSVGTC